MGSLLAEYSSKRVRTHKVNPSPPTIVVTFGTGAGVGQKYSCAAEASILQKVSQHGGVSVGSQASDSVMFPKTAEVGPAAAQLL